MGTAVSRISISESWAMSAAVTVAGPVFLIDIRLGSSPWSFRGIDLRLRMMSVTSSTTPGMVENSWRTPWMRREVMAAPVIEDSRMRRRAFPTVTPYPRSNGWAWKRPYWPVSVSKSHSRNLGLWKFVSVM